MVQFYGLIIMLYYCVALLELSSWFVGIGDPMRGFP